MTRPDNPAAFPDWQPIETAPREVEFRCLLAHSQSVVTGFWNGDDWVNERSASGWSFPATHWMPLPKLPDALLLARKGDGQ